MQCLSFIVKGNNKIAPKPKKNDSETGDSKHYLLLKTRYTSYTWLLN